MSWACAGVITKLPSMKVSQTMAMGRERYVMAQRFAGVLLAANQP